MAIALAIAMSLGVGGCGGPKERSTTIPPAKDAGTQAPPGRAAAELQPPRQRSSFGEAPRPPRRRKRHRLVPGQLWGRRFVAVSLAREGERPATVPVPHTHFSFQLTRRPGKDVEEWVGWDDGCNGFGGQVRVRGDEMRVWNVAGTTVACMSVDKDGNPHPEHGPILMNFFPGTLHWRLDGPHLVITHGSKTLRLRETRR